MFGEQTIAYIDLDLYIERSSTEKTVFEVASSPALQKLIQQVLHQVFWFFSLYLWILLRADQVFRNPFICICYYITREQIWESILKFIRFLTQKTSSLQLQTGNMINLSIHLYPMATRWFVTPSTARELWSLVLDTVSSKSRSVYARSGKLFYHFTDPIITWLIFLSSEKY